MKRYYVIALSLLIWAGCKDKEKTSKCEIDDLVITTGKCTSDSTYVLEVDFKFKNTTTDSFTVKDRDGFISKHHTNELPLRYANFNKSGKSYDYIKICFGSDCCVEHEWKAPSCDSSDCEISDLKVDVGKCNSDGTYNLTIDFEVDNATHTHFDLMTRDNKVFGYYKLADLPLKIKNFKKSGKDWDFIKVCINDNSDCCKVIEFKPPNCDSSCAISEFNVDIGKCNADGTYNLTIDFDVDNPSHTHFDLMTRNNKVIGYYKLSDLPLKIEKFEKSGKDYDYLKVCINDNDDCCKAIEFKPPTCACKLSNIELKFDKCTSDSTYNLIVDFDYTGTTQKSFDVFTRNKVFFGNYKLADLPVTLKNFAKSGKDYDFLKVCINDNADCCIAEEIKTPNCK